VRFGVVAPHEFINLEQWLHEMRLLKSAAEIALMRQAAKISAQAHVRAMQTCKPGMYEYQLEAEISHEFYRQGSRAPAYNSIIAGGENACILHYNENNMALNDGELVLIDAGCEYQHYASDITRTFPVNGRFSGEQRAVYDVVLAAQTAALAQVRPGNTLEMVHMASVRAIVEGLVQLGILRGNVDDLIAQKAHFPFYMHRVGHWLGLDTHDVGNYKLQGDWRALQPGMTHTVEPGIYIAAHIPNVDKKWHNIGVRIEDDVLVTQQGCEVLTAAVPKSAAEIEALMK
jgi:Xaa-Pro aminopeptidase